MCPNVAPDSGNKPGAIIVLVVAHQVYRSILIFSGVLCLVFDLWCFERTFTTRHVVANTEIPELWFLISISPQTHVHQNPQRYSSDIVLKVATSLCGPGELLGTQMFFKAWHLKTYKQMQYLTLGAYLKTPGGPYLGKANIKVFAVLVMCRLLDRHVALSPLLNSNLFMSAISHYTAIQWQMSI